MAFLIPDVLADTCSSADNGPAWLEQLPGIVAELEQRWSLKLAPPFMEEAGCCSWVAPVEQDDGSRAILKIGRPHPEADHEIAGLRFWDGDGIARILDGDVELNAMLLERCDPGTPLWDEPDSEQDAVLAKLLRRLWRVPPAELPFRPLAAMLHRWSEMARRAPDQQLDPALVELGLELFRDLPRSAPQAVVLHTDLHPGNVLRAQREPWLAIDPKPFVGDPAYDATQHLLNCPDRMQADPLATIAGFSDLLGVDRERVRLWTLARAAAQPADDWFRARWRSIAEALAP